jgi:beta-N-acetylhexosaminidase
LNRIAVIAAAAVLIAVGAVVGLSGHRNHSPPPRPSRARLIGQRIMIGFSGLAPPRKLLVQVRNGTVGGVILFAANIRSIAQTRSLTRQLQASARAGGNPPLFVAIDQEGGIVRRFRSGPPTLAPPDMARTGNPAVAYDQGLKTGRLLAQAGVNLNLAPVVDVATSPRSFIAQQRRSFGSDPDRVADFADQFVRGLKSTGVLATAKHFPGIGSALVDTDNKLQRITGPSRQLSDALLPYRRLASHVDMVMLATAIFPAYDQSAPAALSARVEHLLRDKVGFHGVTITDALESPTGSPSAAQAGVRAAAAGADIVLFAGSSGDFPALLDAARRGVISEANLKGSYKRIVGLKRTLKP